MSLFSPHQPGSPLLAATQTWLVPLGGCQLQTSPQGQSTSFSQDVADPPVVPPPPPPLVPPPLPPLVPPVVAPLLQIEKVDQAGRHSGNWQVWPA